MCDILEFQREYFFLSNFYEAPLKYNGLIFPSAESAFQAMKCPERASEFCGISPSDAKRLGRSVKLRSDWNNVREQIMYEICFAKFSQNARLKQKLLATGEVLLVEGNHWHDTFWGVCNGQGANKLGQILMRIRDELGKQTVEELTQTYKNLGGNALIFENNKP